MRVPSPEFGQPRIALTDRGQQAQELMPVPKKEKPAWSPFTLSASREGPAIAIAFPFARPIHALPLPLLVVILSAAKNPS